MAVINYAIQIDTETSVTDASAAIASGVIRVITGRPNYDGTPTYPTWEDSTNNTAVWYEGFIARDGIGEVSRRIDPTVSGDYATLSGFKLELRSTMVSGSSNPLWYILRDNEAWLTNRNARLYVVIDDVFYDFWQGVVGEVGVGETSTTIQLIPNHMVLHKPLPPNVLTETNYPTAPDRERGKPIPIALGDIPYAGLIQSNSDPYWLTLFRTAIQTHSACQATGASVSGEKWVFALNTFGVMFSADELAGKYLFVVSGGGNPNKDVGYKIESNISTVILHPLKAYSTSVVLSEPPEPLLQEFDFDSNFAQDYTAATSLAAWWWFRIADLDRRYLVSNASIFSWKEENKKAIVKSWNTDANEYQEVSRISLSTVTGPPAAIDVVSSRITKDGDIVRPLYVVPTSILSPTLVDLSLSSGDYSTDLTDKDRTTYVRYAGSGETTYSITYRINIGEQLVGRDIDNLYVVPDMSIAATGSFVDIGVTISASDPLGVPFDNGGSENRYPVSAGYYFGGGEAANFLPNEYYETSGNANSEETRWAKTYVSSIGAGGDGNLYTVRDIFKVPDSILTQVKENSMPGFLVIQIRFFGGSPVGLTLDVKQIGLVTLETIPSGQYDFFSPVSGEIVSGSQTSSVYNAYRHILETYDGISSADVDYGNLATKRNTWHVGRHITERKNSFEYLKELCADSFVCMFPTRGRDASHTEKKLKLTAWLDNTTSSATHSESSIVRGSMGDIGKTSIADVYNEFSLEYAYSPGSDAYQNGFVVSKVGESSFPGSGTDTDGDGIEDWKTYFGGLGSGSYADAKRIWDLCHGAYQRLKSLRQMDKSLPWYIDYAQFDSDSTEYTGTAASAYLLLECLAYWTTQQKEVAEYRLPITADNVILELMDYVTVSDTIRTNGVSRGGWVTLVGLVPSQDQISVRTMLAPNEGVDALTADIVETGSAADTITESGSQTDTITEGA